MAVELSGREHEIRSVEQFLQRAARAPEVLVLEGEPGIGKTALWQAGVKRAYATGRRVLEHRAVEAEATLAFAGVGDLLASVADEVLPALGELRRRALEAALLLDGPGTFPWITPIRNTSRIFSPAKYIGCGAPWRLLISQVDRPLAAHATNHDREEET